MFLALLLLCGSTTWPDSQLNVPNHFHTIAAFNGFEFRENWEKFLETFFSSDLSKFFSGQMVALGVGACTRSISLVVRSTPTIKWFQLFEELKLFGKPRHSKLAAGERAGDRSSRYFRYSLHQRWGGVCPLSTEHLPFMDLRSVLGPSSRIREIRKNMLTLNFDNRVVSIVFQFPAPVN